MLAASGAHDTTVTVTIITTIGGIVIALIAVWQVRVTSGAKKDAKQNADQAATSAQMASDYAAAMGLKDALLSAMEDRLKYLEELNKHLSDRVGELERREEEHFEQQRAAALLERRYTEEIAELRQAIEEVRRKRD